MLTAFLFFILGVIVYCGLGTAIMSYMAAKFEKYKGEYNDTLFVMILFWPIVLIFIMCYIIYLIVYTYFKRNTK